MIAVFREMRSESDSSFERARFSATVLRDFFLTAPRAWMHSVVTGEPAPAPGDGPRRPLEDLLSDTRFAFRAMFKRPVFTGVVVATLALGIGANTAIFSLVNEILLRPLPVGNPDTLVDVFADSPGGNSFSGFSYPDFIDYRERADVFEGLSALTGRSLSLGSEGRGESIRVQLVTADYFDIIQVRPAAGRTFSDEESVGRGGGAVAVVSHGYLQRRAGGDQSILGTTIVLNDVPFTIIGVTPEGFEGTFIGFPMEIWIPLSTAERVLTNFDVADRSATSLELVGRRRKDVSLARTQATMDRITRELELEVPLEGRARGVGIAPTTGVDHSMRGGVTGFLVALLATTGLVLLITCLNVGNMLLARAAARQKEMAIRLAIGARRARLASQLLTEAVALFAVGALAGAWVAVQANAWLLRLVAASEMPLGFALPLDWRVLSFTGVVALGAAMLASVFPSREALRNDPSTVLRAGAGDDHGPARKWRDAFVIVQVAGTVVLLTGASLFLRALNEGVRIDPGFEADQVAVTTVTLPETDYDESRGRVFFTELARRASSLPGVRRASLATKRPIGVGLSSVRIEVPGFEPADAETGIWVDSNAVTLDYLETVQVPLVQGRHFEPRDVSGPPVAIVNQTMATRFWGERDPVGQSFTASGMTLRVIGIAADSRTLIQDSTPMPHLYRLFDHQYTPSVNLVLLSDGEPLALRGAVEELVSSLDPTLPSVALSTPREAIDDSLLPQRLAASVTSILGLVALLLAVLGIYGVVSHGVNRRTKELGLRMAIGGRARDIVGLVMLSGMRLAAAGAAIGGLFALGLMPLTSQFLLGVNPLHPLTFITVVLGFLGVAAVASFIPASRATTIDPTTTLRYD